MKSCAACGGAIGEPGKAYSYAGRWCHCTQPIPNDYPHVQGFPDTRPQKLADFVKDLKPPGPIIVVPPPETLTPAEFVSWLKGYFAAGGPHTFTQGDWKRIAEELKKVRA